MILLDTDNLPNAVQQEFDLLTVDDLALRVRLLQGELKDITHVCTENSVSEVYTVYNRVEELEKANEKLTTWLTAIIVFGIIASMPFLYLGTIIGERLCQ